MKNTIILFALCFTTVLFAQEKHQKIKALKVAFITEQLDLTPKEAQGFWPIYNASEEQMEALRKNERSEVIGKIKNDFESLTNAEAMVLIDKTLNFKEKELEIFRALVKDLNAIIPPKKIILLRKAEEDFKRKLLARFRSKKGRP